MVVGTLEFVAGTSWLAIGCTQLKSLHSYITLSARDLHIETLYMPRAQAKYKVSPR